MSEKKQNRTGQLKKALLLSAPFILIAVSFVCLTLWLFGNAIAPSSLYRLLTNAPAATEEDEYADLSDKLDILKESNSGDGFYIPEDFPIIAYGQKWATLTIEDAGIKELDVYSGDSPSLMLKGVGHYSNSRFPGQNGKVVLSAHVKMYFQKLENLQPGAVVKLNTIYGEYVYRVRETLIFSEDDASAVLPQDGEDVLMCYTCYPYKTTKRRTERFAIICEKVSGRDWIENNNGNGGDH